MANELTYDNEPACRDAQRRADVLVHPSLNGIDFVEYAHRPADPLPHVLLVHFLKELPDAPHSDPDGAYGLSTHPEWVRIRGGSRIVALQVEAVTLAPPLLEIAVDRAGDFSSYRLSLGWSLQPDGTLQRETPNLDERFSHALVDFKADCPSEFDCREPTFCPPESREEPLLDYLAKDYASFRQLLLDLITQRNPDWQERNPADLGIALVELLAYAGDHLSYFQDAVANEAYLESARQRHSVRRHARLVDYAVHDGRNAWTHVQLTVTGAGLLPQGTRLITRIADPLQGQTTPPPVVLEEAALPADAFEADPALRRARVFETTHPLTVREELNTLYIHAWGNLECCLPRGSTSLYLYALDPAVPQQAIRPALQAGDYLLLEEILGPETGGPADADPAHRQCVRLATVEEAEDSVYRDTLLNGALQVRGAVDPPLPLLRVTWERSEALGFPLCVSARSRDDTLFAPVSVARGNLVLADHGRMLVEEFPQDPPVPPDEPFHLQLSNGSLSFQCQPTELRYRKDPLLGAVPDEPRHYLGCGADAARPAVALLATTPLGEQLWSALPHLLDSPPYARHFVAETDNRGRARLRFGDGQYGREPAGATSFRVTYRIGNGRAGNIGAEALAHALRPQVAPGWPAIGALRNPLAAAGGADPETLDQVRARAPKAFRAEQFRAVTEADYAAAARRMEGVAGAVARFRWTGSWYTVELAVDPLEPTDLITLSGGRTRLAAPFAERVKAFITRYRLAGYDLLVRSGEYLPLEIDITICVLSGHFRGDVLQAVSWALSDEINPDGSQGLFHPDHLGFGQPLYLSRLYQALEAVEGVDSAEVTRFRGFGAEDNGELEAGLIPAGAWQILRLDNDPNFQENGVLRLSAGGGK